MTKLKMIRLYKADDVPDEIFQKICDLVDEMGKVLQPVMEGQSFNMILSAFARFHAAMICTMVSESHLEDAAKTEAIGLIKNVQHMCGQKFEFLKEEE
jgi:hypothetical protein